MLGKTNISTVEKGVIVSDIEDYSWHNAKIEGVNSAFIKAYCAKDVLIGITKDGTAVYTKDGENWEKVSLQMEYGYTIMDAVWDGDRYIFVGSHFTEDGRCNGLIAVTKDFAEYELMADCTGSEYGGEDDTDSYFGDSDIRRAAYGRFYAIEVNSDSTYALLCAVRLESGNHIYMAAGSLDGLKFKTAVGDGSVLRIGGDAIGWLNDIYAETAKNSEHFLFCVRYPAKDQNSTIYRTEVGISTGNTLNSLTGGTSSADQRLYSVFESKDALYYTCLKEGGLVKVLGFSESVTISGGNSYGFMDAVFFDRCEVFINKHEMLVVRPKEGLADKNLNDLVGITYDFSMARIVKAFNKLYIFGTSGNILVSSDENRNEDVLSVRTMSAARALYDAKAYTDKKCAEMAGGNMDDYVKREELQEIGEERIQEIWDSVFKENESEGGTA